MSAQDIFLGAHVQKLRELKAENARLRSECAAAKDMLASLKSHLSEALLALDDTRRLSADGTLHIWDGWNLILSAEKVAASREELIEQAKALLRERSDDRVWIIFDGHNEHVTNEERLRVSYTGGMGEQRADRAILAFARAAFYLGLAARLRVRTNDRILQKNLSRFIEGTEHERKI